MDAKLKSQKDFKKITKSERKCTSCGFATFCLQVLYRHKIRCQGQLLGIPQRCGYCKRKFFFPFLLKHHQQTCVKRTKKRISFIKLKKKKEKLTNGTIDKQPVKKPSTIVCPLCMTFFDSRELYLAHEESGVCSAQKKVPPKERKSFSSSARKSVQSAPPPSKKSKYVSETPDSDSSFVSDNLLSDIVERNRKYNKSSFRGYACIRCKKKYPAKVILLKHLDLNYRCALAHFELDFYQQKSAKAKKSVQQVVARKSFSNSRQKSNFYHQNKSTVSVKGSARKSLPSAGHRRSFNSQSFKSSSSPVKTLNQCPVCNEEFPNSFSFYQHQKKYSHWGKATKTISLNCKCPFCNKEFFSVRARNAHIRNHADQTDQSIEAFLKKTTCDICTQVFVSESVKLQHIKIEHSTKKQNSADKTDSSDILLNDSSKYSTLPFDIKQKLKQHPTMCPICVEEFITVAFRNQHFEIAHLNSEVECQFCPIRCNTAELVDEHMKTYHYDQFKYECFVCKDKFPSVSHVVTHVKKVHPSHNPKNNQQSAVKSMHRQTSSISDTGKFHSKESQNKNEGYYCDICSLTFPKLQFLRRHEQSKLHRDTLVKNLDAVHESLSNLPPSPSPALPKQIETPKNISCSECFEEFTSLKDFVPHRLGHFGENEKYMEITEDNTYTCEICGDVSDSHSKVQLHLFWHLQVESSSKEKKNSEISQNKPSVSGKSGSQHVAKKSFGKQTRETHQEVVIGGVKKHLFTCEACKVGFTDQTHYNLHVRKFCKMKNNSILKSHRKDSGGKSDSEHTKSESALSSNSNLNKPEKNEVNKSATEVSVCSECCSMYSNSIKEIHDEVCSKCKKSDLEPSSNGNSFKSSIILKKAVAACLKCDSLFTSTETFSEHMVSTHGVTEEKEISLNDENTFVLGGDFVIHCTTCNFIFFSTETLGEHEKMCSKFSYSNSRLENYTPEFKAALEQNSIISTCLNCDLAFNNSQDMTEHLTFHQQNPPDDSEVVVLDGTSEEKMDTGENSSPIDSELLKNNQPAEEVSVTPADTHPEPILINEVVSLESSDVPSNSLESSKIEDIDSLRKNFSQLLSILVSDPDLMQQLGYGELLVDEVLVNVLQTMEQTPVLKDDKTTDLDCLRKNIQILLDFCLEDQIMALIGDGKTSTDDIVVEALKIFGGESSMSIVALE